jgi:hypothetical protein
MAEWREANGLWLAIALGLHGALASAELPRYEPQVLPATLEIGYAVQTVDLDGDGSKAVVVVDSKRLWCFRGPDWQPQAFFSTPEAAYDNVCLAAQDIDGDGRLDFALGADWQFGNTRDGGTYGWLTRQENNTWTYYPLGTLPTLHRMRWADLRGDRRPALVLAPLKGRNSEPPDFAQAGVELTGLWPPESRQAATDPAAWQRELLTDQLHVMHNLDVVDFDADGRDELLCASFEGVSHVMWETPHRWRVTRLGAGEQSRPAPQRGAGEVAFGRPGFDCIATIEPWHGDQVVVYTRPTAGSDAGALWTRQVIDGDLAWGHAVVWADLDGDGRDELVVGVRDQRPDGGSPGIRIYEYVRDQWQRTLLEPGQVAVESLAVDDLNRDGLPEIIAAGRATHNVVIYWARR